MRRKRLIRGTGAVGINKSYDILYWYETKKMRSVRAGGGERNQNFYSLYIYVHSILVAYTEIYQRVSVHLICIDYAYSMHGGIYISV